MARSRSFTAIATWSSPFALTVMASPWVPSARALRTTPPLGRKARRARMPARRHAARGASGEPVERHLAVDALEEGAVRPRAEGRAPYDVLGARRAEHGVRDDDLVGRRGALHARRDVDGLAEVVEPLVRLDRDARPRVEPDLELQLAARAHLPHPAGHRRR